MFWCIETKSQLEKLSNQNYKSAFVEIISFNDNLHPSLNEISLIFIKPESSKPFILCLNHSESLSLKFEDIEELLGEFEILYVRDKKLFLHYFSLNNSVDISYYSPLIEIPQIQIIQHFYNLYPDNLEINKIIPIVKHYEKCEKIYNLYKQYFPNEKNKFNDKADLVFGYIESHGLKTDEELLAEYYEPQFKMLNIQDKTCYSQYNLHTITRRPSNSFNGFNFSALNKENGIRKSFIPQNDKFIEIDFSAYHPYLASQLVNYNFHKHIKLFLIFFLLTF